MQRTSRPYPHPAHRPGAQLPRAGAPSAPAASPRRAPSRRARWQDWLPWALFVLTGLALLSLPVLAAGAYYGYFQVSGRILPGVHVGASQLGGETPTEAAIRLHQDWNMQGELQVTEGVHTWQVSPGLLGLSVDSIATAQAAAGIGHNQPLLAEIDQLIRSSREGWGVAPVVVFDPEAARAGLQALNDQVRVLPRNASVRLEGDRLAAVPAEIGYSVNIEASLAELQADPMGVLLGGSFRLALKPDAPAVTDVSQALAEGERLLSAAYPLRAYDPVTNESLEWTPTRQELASWLVVSTREDGSPQLSLDETRAAAYLEGISASLGPDRRLALDSGPGQLADLLLSGGGAPLTVRHSPTTYTVEPGDTLIKIGWKVGIPYWRILQANPGLDGDALYAGQSLTVPSKDDLLPLPVAANKRIVISISQQRLWTYQDGSLRSEHVISTGIDRSPTQPGIFQVQTHELSAYASVWDLTMPHFIGIYEAWPGFMNGIHGLPTLSNGQRLWGNILGRPASYGCIIMDLQAAEDLFNWAEAGVVVEIQP